MPPDLKEALRARAADLPFAFVEEALGRFTGDAARQYRPMIEAAQVASEQARATLTQWVVAGRRAGMSWTDIGRLLNISKQAAQQRFGGDAPAPPFGTIAVVPGAGGLSEAAILEREGDAGRELIEVDATRLLFRQTDRRWRYRRTVGVPVDCEPQAGWQFAAEWLVFAYYKREG